MAARRGLRPRHQNPPTRTHLACSLCLSLSSLDSGYWGCCNACLWVGVAQDAEVPPVGSGAGVLPQPQHAFGAEEARTSGHVGAPPAMYAAPLLKRKGEEAPQPWFDVDGVPIPATKIRRLVRNSANSLARSLAPSLPLSN